jgi:hypothetical protein
MLDNEIDLQAVLESAGIVANMAELILQNTANSKPKIQFA